MRGPPGVIDTLRFLRHPASAILSLVLLGQAGVYYLVPKSELAPAAPAMSGFPSQLGVWRMTAEYPIEDEILRVLRANDTLNRVYNSPQSPFALNLFMAYFRSQKTGAAPHSPKNCLPGSGWAPLSSEIVRIPVPGLASPLEVNRFIVARGTEKTLVLYWYQTAHRAIASEYEAKVWLVLDSLRYRRSDTAIVRVVAPLPEGREEEVRRVTSDFIAAAMPAISAQVPQ
jgi:EpsI family protein